LKTNLYIVLALFLFKINVYSQINSGIINYEISVNTEDLINGLKDEKLPSDQKEYMISLFKNSEKINYQLHFNNQVSNFYYVKSLQVDDNLNFTLSFFGDDTYFTDVKSKKILKDNSYLENKLIEYEPYKWVVTTKTKKIGNYLCYMATAVEKTERDGNVRKTKITAWFTPDIPISFGPKKYSGLPGLVLEVSSGIITIKATKIKLNSNYKDLKIVIPKGEVITNAESELIFKEMLGNRRKMN